MRLLLIFVAITYSMIVNSETGYDVKYGWEHDFSKVTLSFGCHAIGTTELSEDNFRINTNVDKGLPLIHIGEMSKDTKYSETTTDNMDWEFNFKQYKTKVKAFYSIYSSDTSNSLPSNIERKGSVSVEMNINGQSFKTSTDTTSLYGLTLLPEASWLTVSKLSQTIDVSDTESLIITCGLYYQNPNYAD